MEKVISHDNKTANSRPIAEEIKFYKHKLDEDTKDYRKTLKQFINNGNYIAFKLKFFIERQS